MTESILVVDDEAVNRDLLEAVLVDAGYQVHLADGGSEALAHVASAPPELILLDLMMPGMNGLEACQRLKQDPGTAGIPVIVVTALGQITTKEVAMTSGADDFVAKPIQPKDLVARVKAMLRVRGIRQGLDRTLAYLHELEGAQHAHRREALGSLIPQASSTPIQEATVLPILLADDDPLTRQFYGELLAEHGFQVIAASDGQQALELVQRHPVEAAILDIMMPGMSGLEVMGHLHAQDPDLPVVMLTAHASSRKALAALTLGAFDFIVKGLDHDLVVLAVHRAVRQRRAAIEQKRENEWLRSRLAESEGHRPQQQGERSDPSCSSAVRDRAPVPICSRPLGAMSGSASKGEGDVGERSRSQEEP